MGLDVLVLEYLEIPDTVKTEKELTEFCKANNGEWTFYEEWHKNFPKKFVKSIQVELVDWKATFKKRGLNYEDYEETCEAVGRWWEFTKKADKRTADEDETIINIQQFIDDDQEPDPNNTVRVRFTYDDDIITKVESCEVFAYGREVGYQRKGANAQFYNDGKWDDNTIVSTKEMLLEDWKKYFSDPHDEYYGRGAKEEFKKNIIDHFIEGKTFVAYW